MNIGWLPSPTQKIPNTNSPKPETKVHPAQDGQKTQSKKKTIWRKKTPNAGGEAHGRTTPPLVGSLVCKDCKKTIPMDPFYEGLIKQGRKTVACSECQAKWRAARENRDDADVHLCDAVECVHGINCRFTTHYHRAPKPKEGAAKRVAEKEGKEKSPPTTVIRARRCKDTIADCKDAMCHHHRAKVVTKVHNAPGFELTSLSEDEDEEFLGISVVKGKTVATYTPRLRNLDIPRSELKTEVHVVTSSTGLKGGESPISRVATETPTGPAGDESPKQEVENQEPPTPSPGLAEQTSVGVEEDAGETSGGDEDEKGEGEPFMEDVATILATAESDVPLEVEPEHLTKSFVLKKIQPLIRARMLHHAALYAVALHNADSLHIESYGIPALIRGVCEQLHGDLVKDHDLPAFDTIFFGDDESKTEPPSIESAFKGTQTAPSVVANTDVGELERRIAKMKELLQAEPGEQPESVNSARNTPTVCGERKTLSDIEDMGEWRWPKGCSLTTGAYSAWRQRFPLDHQVDFGKLGKFKLKPPPPTNFGTKEVTILCMSAGQDMRYAISRWFTNALTSLPYVHRYSLLPIEESDATCMTRANTVVLRNAHHTGIHIARHSGLIPKARTVATKYEQVHQHMTRFGYVSARDVTIFVELYKMLVSLPGIANINTLSLQTGTPMTTAMASLSSVAGQAKVSEYRAESIEVYDNTIMYLYQQKLLTESKYLDATPIVPGQRPANGGLGPPLQ